MASSTSVNTLEFSKVTPSPDSPLSATQFSLPLTFFDTFWLKFPPVERIFFYKLAESTPAFFNSTILPTLKHSLSLTLPHFLPLAGKLTWPPDSTKPLLIYTPNDGVSLTVSDSNADLNHLSSNKSREAADSHPYIPKLDISESKASVIALQITLFPNQGFCIGIISHHAVLDGKSATMFIKAWAHICKQIQNEKSFPSLSPELTPSYDRTLVQDPEGFAIVYLNKWFALKWPGLDTNPRSLKLLPLEIAQRDFVRATFELSREDVKKLRKKVLSRLHKVPQDGKNYATPVHLSTFVLALAHTIVCRVKAKGEGKDRTILFAVVADCRARFDPPLPANYFGNCVGAYDIHLKAEALMEEDGLALAASRISEVIQGLQEGAVDKAKRNFRKFFDFQVDGNGVGVAGSPRFEVYATDFGWGRPEKVEVTSIDRTGAISMAESKDGEGGVEVGLALKKQEMEMFNFLFVDGLKDP